MANETSVSFVHLRCSQTRLRLHLKITFFFFLIILFVVFIHFIFNLLHNGFNVYIVYAEQEMLATFKRAYIPNAACTRHKIKTILKLFVMERNWWLLLLLLLLQCKRFYYIFFLFIQCDSVFSPPLDDVMVYCTPVYSN